MEKVKRKRSRGQRLAGITKWCGARGLTERNRYVFFAVFDDRLSSRAVNVRIRQRFSGYRACNEHDDWWIDLMENVISNVKAITEASKEKG